MKKLLMIFGLLILMSVSVISIAPEKPERLHYGYPYIIYDTDLVTVHYLVEDQDTLLLNCTLYYSNSTNSTEPHPLYYGISGYGEFPDNLSLLSPIKSSEEFFVLNNTEEDFVLDIKYLYPPEAEGRVYYSLVCTDGVDSTSSNIWAMDLELFFQYTSDDISRSIINTMAKTVIAFSSLLLLFIGLMFFIWGKKTFDDILFP